MIKSIDEIILQFEENEKKKEDSKREAEEKADAEKAKEAEMAEEEKRKEEEADEKKFSERFGKHFSECAKSFEERVAGLEEGQGKIMAFMEKMAK